MSVAVWMFNRWCVSVMPDGMDVGLVGCVCHSMDVGFIGGVCL